MNRLKRVNRGIAVGLILMAAHWSSTVQAKKDTSEDSGAVRIETTPTFYIQSDGTRYTGLSAGRHPTQNWTIGARFTYDAPDNDRIKSYNLQLRMKWENAGRQEKYLGSNTSHSYKLGSRPKKIDKTVFFNLGADVESFLVNACNAGADGFRRLGQSNATIFSRVHNINARIYASHAIDNQPVPPNSFLSGYAPRPDRHVKIVCMKAPAPQFDTAGSLQLGSAVTQSSLSVLEQSTLGGSCKVNLSTVVQTSLPNTQVRFRFEHSNGRKSAVKTVTTSQSKTAMTAYWYDTPKNPNGTETGMVRMVGVSHPFESAWKGYEMDCRESGPSGLALVQKPVVKVDVRPTSFTMINGLRCPRQVDITTSISSKKAFNGNGVLTVRDGSYGFSSHQVNVQPYLVWKKTESLALKPWGHSSGINNTLQIQPGSQGQQMSQRFDLRYILSANQSPVVQTPFKTVVVRCTRPLVNPRLQPGSQGLTAPARSPVESKPAASKQVAPGRLMLNTGAGASR